MSEAAKLLSDDADAFTFDEMTCKEIQVAGREALARMRAEGAEEGASSAVPEQAADDSESDSGDSDSSSSDSDTDSESDSDSDDSDEVSDASDAKPTLVKATTDETDAVTLPTPTDVDGAAKALAGLHLTTDAAHGARVNSSEDSNGGGMMRVVSTKRLDPVATKTPQQP